jgi:hypothetical protein
LLYNAFLYKINSQVFFWIFIVALALICGILALIVYDHALILATSLAGAFLFTAGIGLVAGHYPNPFTIVEQLKNGTIDHIDPIFYAYLAGTLVLWVLGAIVQYTQRRHDHKNGRDPYHKLKQARE